jgi:O-succinylbenzoate synthase
MKIEQVEMVHLRMELRAPFRTSFGVEVDRDCILLCVRSEGVEGWGECVATSVPGYNYETVGTAWHILSDFFIPAILGQEIKEIQDFIDRIVHFRGHELARAGLEMALWDLFGQASRKSLFEMIGGVKDKVDVGVSIGLKKDDQTLLESVSDYVNSGYRRVKLKIEPGRDVEMVHRVRSEFPELMLQVDANSAYQLSDIDVFEAMDGQGLLLIEQPLAEDDLVDHRHLQIKLKTAICLDESILCLRHARQALELGSCRVINIKPGRVGGLTEAKRIHDYCLERGVPVWCGGMLETNIGRASNVAMASLEGFSLPGDISASDRYYWKDIADPSFSLNADSTIDVPSGYGLGVKVDSEAVKEFALRRETFKG